MYALPVNTPASPSRGSEIAFLAIVGIALFLCMIVFHWKSFGLFMLLIAADIAGIIYLAAGEVAAIVAIAVGFVLSAAGRGKGGRRTGSGRSR